MDIKLTDIFNISITPSKKGYNKDYMVLHINHDNIDDYLTAVNQYNGVYIYKLKKSKKIYYCFNKLGLDIDNYVELGNYIIYDTNNVNILLINKNKTKTTNKYNLIDTIGELYVWKPVSINNNYTNLGVIVTKNNLIPNEEIGLIPNEYIKIFDNSYADIYQNDYNLLGSKRDNKKKILTYNIINENNDNISSDSINTLNDTHQGKEFDYTHKWDVYQTQTFILIENDNPWYKNKKNTIPEEYINNNDYFKMEYKKCDDTIINDIEVTNNINTENKSLFNNTNYIILFMLMVIILLFIYNRYGIRNF